MLKGLAMEDAGIFYDRFVYFVSIWSILCPFGLFCGHLVILWTFGNFVDIWYILWLVSIFFPFWYVVPIKIWQPWEDEERTFLWHRQQHTHVGYW
jgi:hypothetical protein